MNAHSVERASGFTTRVLPRMLAPRELLSCRVQLCVSVALVGSDSVLPPTHRAAMRAERSATTPRVAVKAMPPTGP